MHCHKWCSVSTWFSMANKGGEGRVEHSSERVGSRMRIVSKSSMMRNKKKDDALRAWRQWDIVSPSCPDPSRMCSGVRMHRKQLIASRSMKTHSRQEQVIPSDGCSKQAWWLFVEVQLCTEQTIHSWHSPHLFQLHSTKFRLDDWSHNAIFLFVWHMRECSMAIRVLHSPAPFSTFASIHLCMVNYTPCSPGLEEKMIC